MGMGLTVTQAKLLRFLETEILERDRVPSFDEMMVALGLNSKSGVYRILSGLEARGKIRRMPNLARAIQLLETKSITLSPEVAKMLANYLTAEGIATLDAAANVVLRNGLHAA